MQKLTVLSIVLLMALLLGGCMRPVQDARAAAAVTGNVTYTTGPDGTVQVGPIAATKKACSEPANVMEQESQYLAALQSAATYQLQDDSLTVQNADGEMAVQYERVGP